VASGYVHEYEVERDGGSVTKEEFVARKIGHNVNKTVYEVQRRRLTPTSSPAAPQPPDPAIGF
jgi:single-strand DNA-binding protein